MMLVLIWVGEYQLADNPASLNVFRSDFQDAPIIGPIPREITHGRTLLSFHECGMKYHKHDEMLDEIIDIYNDVTFGKNYKSRCKGPQTHQIYVHINFNKKSSAYLPEGFDIHYEEYRLEVDDKGQVNLTADYYPGIVRGLDTLSQLIVQANDEDYEHYEIEFTPIKIKDYPEYPYRGLMIDTAREYFFPDVIKNALDGMMLGRNNVFHWHFAEDDSIPMFSESYPDLVNYTAYSKR